MVIILGFGRDGEWKFGVLGVVDHLIGGAKFGNLSYALERFYVVVDAEETFECVDKFWVGEEILVTKEGF